jgi:hypothetical protein
MSWCLVGSEMCIRDSFVLLLETIKNNRYSFKKVAVAVGTKNKDFVEILPNTIINASSKILTKGVFEIVN